MLRLPVQLQLFVLSCALLAIPQIGAVDAEHDAHPHTTQDEGDKVAVIESEPTSAPLAPAISAEAEGIVKAPVEQESKKQFKKKKKKKKKALKKKHKCQKKKLKKKQKQEKQELKQQQKEEEKALEREGPPQE